ncbi:MAG: hybrid sensor histidine kinase/response regulator, partial [Nostocaceae cyanobacterium]|nr:hybrid sensor histidine kinase/response regulator [Nostocaceae cyanobacterium]
PGFGEIAQTLRTALEANPDQVQAIAAIALADLNRGRDGILAGDRVSGGVPSIALQNFTVIGAESLSSPDFYPTQETLFGQLLDSNEQSEETFHQFSFDSSEETFHQFSSDSNLEAFAEFPSDSNLEAFAQSPLDSSEDISVVLTNTVANPEFAPVVDLQSEITNFSDFLTESDSAKEQPLKPAIIRIYLKTIRYIFGWLNHEANIPYQKLSLSLLIPKLQQGDRQELEEHIDYFHDWIRLFFEFIQEEKDSYSLCIYRQKVILNSILAVAKYQYIDGRQLLNRDSDISVIQTLKNQIREVSKEYKNLPPITGEETKWLDRPKLKNLLEIKEIPTTITEESTNTTDLFEHAEESGDLINSIATTESSDNLESIWGAEVSEIPNETIANTVVENPIQEIITQETVSIQAEVISTEETQIAAQTTTQITSQTTSNYQKPLQKNPSEQPQKTRQQSFVRVDVEGLERLNYLAGELLIFQKRRALQDEQLKANIELLFQQLQRHQNTLGELRDLPLQKQIPTLATPKFSAVDFDVLEWDQYTEFHVALHEASEETLQLQETTESLELILRQSAQIQEKKQRLLLNIIEHLVDARMIPLGNVLSRFPSMVQKLANVYGKMVELKLIGTSVLIDKAIAEKLQDPLLQLVRNSFDHGIEPPELRREQGKPEQGAIEICAYHQGSQTVIEVRDDGRGLNLDKVRHRAIELNLIPDPEQTINYTAPTESDLLDVLFEPGFSTAAEVSEISGRGMGLDIVRSHIESLNGSITVRSTPKLGTSFILKIPFSMTTAQLMLVQAGGTVYALLLDSIERILLPTAEQVKEYEGRKVLHWSTGTDERMIALRQLSDLMHYYHHLSANTRLLPKVSDTKITNPILLLRRNQEIFGLEVDQIIGEQELVIRPLGNAIIPPKYIYGCSSLANGTMILVIDAAMLLSQDTSPVFKATPAIAPAQDLSQLATIIESQQLLAAGANNNVKTLVSALVPAPRTAHQPQLLLVVDDAISLRQTLSLTLQKHGYQVIQAQDGVEALEKLRQHPEISLVVSDLEMPRMNGFEFLTNIRTTPNAKTPVVVLTSRSAEKHRQLAQELGAGAYLTKPYLEHDLINTVENLIDRQAVVG